MIPLQDIGDPGGYEHLEDSAGKFQALYLLGSLAAGAMGVCHMPLVSLSSGLRWLCPPEYVYPALLLANSPTLHPPAVAVHTQ